MSIAGVGIDVIEVGRIDRLVREWGGAFLGRVYTDQEVEYCRTKKNTAQHLAGRFAAKEAVIKAVGNKLPWKSIEVRSGPNGKPKVHIREKVQLFPSARPVFHLSITHEAQYAAALVVLETDRC